MTPTVQTTAYGSRAALWTRTVWFSALLLACYAPVLWRLAKQWEADPDMGHGFFVPVLAGYVAWRRRDVLALLKPAPNWWGLVIVIFAAAQSWVATVGAEIFLARIAFVLSLIGMVLLLGGVPYLRVLGFPLFLLFFMIPLPAIIYTRITFPLQILASKVAATALAVLQIPVLREGNILELAEQKLSVVEACSGIRSLLSLTFLSLVYGHFFERRTWVKAVLFMSTVTIAIIANAGRVTLTGVLTDVKPELAEGFFHTASGWVIFMIALAMLIAFHQVLDKVLRRFRK